MLRSFCKRAVTPTLVGSQLMLFSFGRPPILCMDNEARTWNKDETQRYAKVLTDFMEESMKTGKEDELRLQWFQNRCRQKFREIIFGISKQFNKMPRMENLSADELTQREEQIKESGRLLDHHNTGSADELTQREEQNKDHHNAGSAEDRPGSSSDDVPGSARRGKVLQLIGNASVMQKIYTDAAAAKGFQDDPHGNYLQSISDAAVKKGKRTPIDCTICSRRFLSGQLMPMQVHNADWQKIIRICFDCARGTVSQLPASWRGMQPWLTDYTGFAIDFEEGSTSPYPDINDHRPSIPSNIPASSLQTYTAIRSEQGQARPFQINWRWVIDQWDHGQWAMDTYRPDLNNTAALLAWNKECSKAWKTRGQVLTSRATRARCADYDTMIAYQMEKHPGQGRNALRRRAMTRVDAISRAYVKELELMDDVELEQRLQTGQEFRDNWQLAAEDITESVKTLSDEISHYWSGFATQITQRIGMHWLCRDPMCRRVIHACFWLRTTEHPEEHGRFACPACGKEYYPWVSITIGDWKETIKACRNNGDPTRFNLLPANKVLIVKEDPDAETLDSDPAKVVMNDLNAKYYVYPCHWPDKITDDWIQKNTAITHGVLDKIKSIKTPEELVDRIHKPLHDHQPAGLFQQMTTPDDVWANLQWRNSQRKAPWLLDEAVRTRSLTPQENKMTFPMLQLEEFRVGTPRVLDQEDVFMISAHVQIQLLAQAHAARRRPAINQPWS